MTEAEWLACIDPTPMLELLRGKISDRKYRFFSLRCLRCIEPKWWDERSKAAIEVLDCFLDGGASTEDLRAAFKSAIDALRWIVEDANEQRWYYIQLYTAEAVCLSCDIEYSNDALLSIVKRVTNAIALGAVENEAIARQRQHAAQANWLREIVGSPFHTFTIDPSLLAWNDGTVVRIAQAIYDERAFDWMPILADALEDAGCDNADILRHCREPGEHVRGCWVVDLLLGKE
jgi:hypothetical protein